MTLPCASAPTVWRARHAQRRARRFLRVREHDGDRLAGPDKVRRLPAPSRRSQRSDARGARLGVVVVAGAPRAGRPCARSDRAGYTRRLLFQTRCVCPWADAARPPGPPRAAVRGARLVSACVRGSARRALPRVGVAGAQKGLHAQRCPRRGACLLPHACNTARVRSSDASLAERVRRVSRRCGRGGAARHRLTTQHSNDVESTVSHSHTVTQSTVSHSVDSVGQCRAQAWSQHTSGPHSRGVDSTPAVCPTQLPCTPACAAAAARRASGRRPAGRWPPC